MIAKSTATSRKIATQIIAKNAINTAMPPNKAEKTADAASVEVAFTADVASKNMLYRAKRTGG